MTTPTTIPTPDDVYVFIAGYRLLHDGQSPTIRVIQSALGFSSTSVTNSRLHALERAGKIWRDEDNNLRLDARNKVQP